MNVLSRAVLLPLLLGASPVPLPECRSGELLVSTGSSYRCASLTSLLEKQRSSGWGAENVLPTCSSGNFLQSEGSGRWRCVEAERMPRCSSGDSLRSEGSSGWSCAEKAVGLPSCSSG